MKAKEIQELIDFISNTGLAEVKIKTDEFKLSIKKFPDTTVIKSDNSQIQQPAPNPVAVPVVLAQPVPAAAAKDETNNIIEIKSPMIGTFYRTANPDSDPFITIGDTVVAGQTVCIIEAMKLFNEIESEISGKIVKVLVENATPVEYDQPLFLVDPAG
jgi:acetyl-CoA carboxylase biotin carboxyl carrier protein